MAAADRSVHPPRSTDLPQQPFALTPLLHRAPKMQGRAKVSKKPCGGDGRRQNMLPGFLGVPH